MFEGRDLGSVKAFGKASGLSSGRGVRIEGVGGEVGVGGVDGGGVGGVGAAREETGEEASEAQGGDFEEIAFGARGGQEGHELRSKVMHG
jgi:hypothetical protein